MAATNSAPQRWNWRKLLCFGSSRENDSSNEPNAKPTNTSSQPSTKQSEASQAPKNAAGKDLLVIVGASGVQGSGVIKAVLAHPGLSSRFSIRALSRDPEKLKTQTEAFIDADTDKGAHPQIEYVAANIDDPSSLSKAFEGAHTVFGLTNYYETRDLHRDVAQGKNIADAAKSAGVKHLIWSSMRDSADVSDGQITDAPGLDGKAEVSKYIESMKKDGNAMAATHMLVGFYLSNIARIWGYDSPADGVFECKFPWSATEVQLPFVDAAVDVGRFVAGVMLNGPEAMDSVYVNTVSEWTTPKELLSTFQKVKGREMRYEEISKDEFAARLPEPLKVEKLDNLLTIIGKYELFGKGSAQAQGKHDEILKDLGVPKSGWEEYLKRDFDADFKNPMFPPFMFPYLQSQAQEEMATKDADNTIHPSTGDEVAA